MEAQGGPRNAKVSAKDPFWEAQGQLNGLKCEPETPRKKRLGVLGRTSEQPKRPNAKNLKKGILTSTIFLSKIQKKKMSKNTPRPIKLSTEKYTYF